MMHYIWWRGHTDSLYSFKCPLQVWCYRAWSGSLQHVICWFIACLLIKIIVTRLHTSRLLRLLPLRRLPKVFTTQHKELIL